MTPLGFLPLKDAVAKCCEAWQTEPQDAYERLRPYLDAGEIKSAAKYGDGLDKNIGAAWASSLNNHAHLDGKLKFDQGGVDGPYGLPAFVHRGDLDVLLGAKVSQKREGVADAGEKSNGGGRKQNVDADKFWAEVERLVDEGLHADPLIASHTVEALVLTMDLWKKRNMQRPWKRSTLKRYIEAKWRDLQQRSVSRNN